MVQRIELRNACSVVERYGVRSRNPLRRRPLPKIIEEMISLGGSERENRAIDHDGDDSMEVKKREGYFLRIHRSTKTDCLRNRLLGELSFDLSAIRTGVDRDGLRRSLDIAQILRAEPRAEKRKEMD